LVNDDNSISDTDKKLLIQESLKLLAENTGCAEDSEIAEDILDFLFYNQKILNQKNIDFFYNHSSTERWN
jgi:hypothetical protein